MAEPAETQEVVETVEAVVVESAEQVAITQDDVRLVEAILFAATAPVSVGQIAERFPEDRVMLIPDILDIIKEHYAGRGVNLVARDSKFALRTATDLGDSLRLEKEQPKKFTRAAQETMAIIAYHQPVTRAEIENIRGVATSPGALDALLEAGWIKPGKRREVPGRPVTWLTTQAFLDHFGLERLEDLPGMDELKAAGLLDKRPAIEAMPSTADLFDGANENAAEEEITDEDLIGKGLTDGEESGFAGEEDEPTSEEESEEAVEDTEDEDVTSGDEEDFDDEDEDDEEEDDDEDDEDEDDEEEEDEE